MKVMHPRCDAANVKMVQMSGGDFHVASLLLPRLV